MIDPVFKYKISLFLCHITYQQVFAFSSENWQRSNVEVAFLMSLFTKALRNEGTSLYEKGIRFRSIGDRDRLPEQLQKEILW